MRVPSAPRRTLSTTWRPRTEGIETEEGQQALRGGRLGIGEQVREIHQDIGGCRFREGRREALQEAGEGGDEVGHAGEVSAAAQNPRRPLPPPSVGDSTSYRSQAIQFRARNSASRRERRRSALLRKRKGGAAYRRLTAKP